MSTVYNLEPPPTAKVLLNTTSGDILLELFAKQTPLTSRNFLQHCLDGYYNDTIFHRLVPGFIVQGGDPTGTGEGGESIYNDNANNVFADEFHSRLKFNRRGLLGMANGGRKDDNGSQFFLTLAKTEELNGRNTMFGRVVGDTIYNVMKMSEAEIVEGTERPVYPMRILGVEVLVNPFEDMVARERKTVGGGETGAKKEAAKRKAKRKGGKALLSFGGEEEDEGDTEVIVKKAKFNTKLVTAGAESTLEARTEENTPAATTILTTRPTSPSRSPPARTQQKSPSPPQRLPPKSSRSSHSQSSSPSPPPAPPTLLTQTLTQISALTTSLKRRPPSPPPVRGKSKKSALAQLIPPTSTRARKRGAGGASAAEDRKALEALEKFRRKLEGAGAAAVKDEKAPAKKNSNGDGKEKSVNEEANNDPDEEMVCDLHFLSNCLSCTPHLPAPDNPPSPLNDTTWLTHTLSFAKDRLGKDLDWKRKNEELAVEDPWEGSAGGAGGKGKSEDGKWKKDGGGRGKGRDGGRAWDRR